MKVIPPLTITDAMLTSSSAAEPGPGEVLWVSGAPHAPKDVRIRTQTHRRYECLVAVSGAVPPELDSVHWSDIGPTNRGAAFDLLRSSATEQPDSLTLVITPGRRCTALGLVGLQADQVEISVSAFGTLLRPPIVERLQLRNTTSWLEYLYGEFRSRRSLVRFDLPAVTNAVITITLTKPGGTVKCGGVVLGNAIDLGRVLREPDFDVLNFSKIARDPYSNITQLSPIRNVPNPTMQLLAHKSRIDKLIEARQLLDAVPALYCGLDDNPTSAYFEAMLIFGIYRQFKISPAEGQQIRTTLTLEEM